MRCSGKTLSWVVSVSVSVFLFSGCASAPKKQQTGLTSARFFQLQRDRAKAFLQTSGKVSLRYDGTHDSISGKGRYLAGGKDQFRLEIRDPLGRLHYLAALSQKSFQAQYPRQSKAYVDEQGGRMYLRKLAGISSDFSGLVDLAVGIIPSGWSKNSFDKWEWDDSAGIYRGEAKLTSGDITAEVDGATGTLVSFVVKNPATVLQVKYSELEPCCDGFAIQQTLARVAEVRWPQSKSSFEFEWNDLKLLEHQPKEASFQPALDDKWKITKF